MFLFLSSCTGSPIMQELENQRTRRTIYIIICNVYNIFKWIEAITWNFYKHFTSMMWRQFFCEPVREDTSTKFLVFFSFVHFFLFKFSEDKRIYRYYPNANPTINLILRWFSVTFSPNPNELSSYWSPSGSTAKCESIVICHLILYRYAGVVVIGPVFYR